MHLKSGKVRYRFLYDRPPAPSWQGGRGFFRGKAPTEKGARASTPCPFGVNFCGVAPFCFLKSVAIGGHAPTMATTPPGKFYPKLCARPTAECAVLGEILSKGIPKRGNTSLRHRRGRVLPLLTHSQPFKPADATPCTKYFCSDRNTISTGIRAMTDAAMIRPYSAEYWLMNMRRPIWMVLSRVSVR